MAPLLILMGLSVLAQEAKPPFPIEQWLQGPDRRAFPWKVKIGDPTLTYQQRFLLVVSGSVDGSVLRKKPGREFVVVVKLGDMNGNWFPGEDRTDCSIDKEPPQPIDFLSLYTGVYLRPGDYRVAVIIYDTAHGEGNIEHRTLHIPAPKNDPLRDLGRDLPAVEFPSRIPGMADAPLHDPGWSLAQSVERLPVATSRPLLIDVVLDVSGLTPQIALEMGSVLSHLQPSYGCVRVSIMDITRMHLFLDRQDVT